MSTLTPAAPSRHRLRRWLVHVGLIGCAVASLGLEPVLAAHVALGVAFAVLVGVHLAQRRVVSRRLATRLLRVRSALAPGGRLAQADGLLFIVTSAVLVSGFWDLWAPHHTTIRWHALTGVAVTIFVAVHTARQWRRLRDSQIR